MIRVRVIAPAVLLLTLASLTAAQTAPSHPVPQDKSASAPAPAAAPTPAAAPAAHSGAHAGGSAADAAIIAAQKPSYPLKTCLVSDEPLGGSMGAPADYVHEGRFMLFCCPECKSSVAADPAKYLAKLDAAVIAAQKPGYPLKTCVISGEPFDGKPIDFVYGTRLVELCCKDCKQDFLKDPAPALAAIDAALIEQQSASYPLTTCVVSGEALEDVEPLLYGTQLVKFCCKLCIGEFRADPDKYLAAIAAAQQAAARGGSPDPAKRAAPAGGAAK